MRDLTIGSVIAAFVAFGLLHPWIGVLGWTWISIMNPHALTWAVKSMPVAAAVGGATLIGLVITRDRRNFFVTRETATLMLFMVWMTICLPFSMIFDPSFELWKRVIKIDLMILVAMVVLYSKQHIIALAWVLVVSLGFYGTKGGLFTLATGGSYRVWGPEGTYIEGNNEVALALVIIIPIMQFLRLTSQNIWVKRGLLVSMLLCAAAALGSHSRGALLAIVAMAFVLWWRSDGKILKAILFVLVASAMLSFMPEEWWARMGTIGTYKEDTSAMGRINAWWMAWNLAKDNVFGGGFMVWTGIIFAKYAPDPTAVHAAHSIYFMVLGELGFIGLFIFLLLWLFVWLSAGHLRLNGPKRTETAWLSHLGSMCQVSMAGYAVGGAFLSLSYYDLPYNLLILVVLGRRWIEGKEWISEAQIARDKEALRAAKKPKLSA
jgi:putative inorganic carbon (hco3(-)) transporter